MVINIKDSVELFFDYFKDAFERYESIPSIGPFNSIGMGGSGIAGRIIRDYYTGASINCEYFPNSALDKKLIYENNVLVSYSGNTRETLSWLNVERVRKNFVALCSGGKLEREAINNNSLLIKIPPELQPRASLPYMLVSLSKLHSIKTFEDLRVKYKRAESNKIILDKKVEEYLNNIKTPIYVYGDCITSSIAYRAKTQFNENSKCIANFNVMSEALHNEPEAMKEMNGTILLILHNNSINKKISKALRDSYGEKVVTHFSSNNFVEDIYLFDKLSVELSKKRAIPNPTDVPYISKLKREING